jgi:hypothetical protein
VWQPRGCLEALDSLFPCRDLPFAGYLSMTKAATSRPSDSEMSSTILEDTPLEYHPAFAAPDADIVLRSSDGIHFRIRSIVLCRTCDFFAQMLSLPQGYLSSTADVISLDETAVVLEKLLRMISGLEFPRWDSYDEVESVVFAAEKYGAPGPIAIIRSAITAPHFLETPLRLYALAAHFSWEDELKLASKLTLALTIYDGSHDSILERIPSPHIFRLLKLHNRRREGFRHLVDEGARFKIGNNPKTPCMECARAINNRCWIEMKTSLCREFDRRPLGDTLFTAETLSWPEVTVFRDSKCPCGAVLYVYDMTLDCLRGCIGELPLTV